MKFSEMPYTRPDMAEAAALAAAVKENVQNAKSAAEIMEQYKIFAAFRKKLYTLQSISSVRHTVDTRDEFYDKENDFFDANGPLFTKLGMDFYKTMVESPFRAELETILGKLWFTNAELILKGFDEKIIEDMQKDNALSSKYEKLLASASLDFNGEKLNLSQLGKYMQSKDRGIRKAAYAKRTEFFVEHSAELDEIYDEMVRLRDGMAKKLGYKNFVELGYIWMQRNSYDAEAVGKYREQVKKVLVPFLRGLHEQRGKDLGVEKLKFYDEDIFFPDGNPEPKGTPDEMFAAGKKMYAELSPETKVFFEFMLENELFDVLAKEGKAGGGYCTFMPEYGSPFVFANFNGTSGDVDVLTHECGHALCAYLAANIEILEYQEYTYEVAEIHSMSMEFFTSKWMDLFFDKEAGRYLYMHLASALTFIPYGCMVDEFQHIIYSNPELSPDERKAVWQKLETEYKPHLDFDGDPFFGKGGHWQRQSHIYQRPFYYIDYCLAQTCALQFRVWMEKDREAAWKSYISLLKKAGTKKFTELVDEAELKSPFGPECIKTIVENVDAILAELRNS